MKQKISTAEVRDWALDPDNQDGSTGLCLSCGMTQFGVEPDAESYTCEYCGEAAVDGLLSVLLTVQYTLR